MTFPPILSPPHPFPDFVRLVVYSVFFGIVMHYYGLPLHIVRDLWLTFRSFSKRLRDMMQYHRATANMNERHVTFLRACLATR